MILDNKNMILYYNLNLEEQEIINNLTKENNIKGTKEITSKMGDMTIKDIIAGKEFLTASDSLPKDGIVLFNNVSDDGLNSIIKGIRENFKDRPIMAVVTKTSEKWTFKYLLEHLIEEREWYKKHDK